MSEIDSGTVTGTPLLRSPYTTQDGLLLTGTQCSRIKWVLDHSVAQPTNILRVSTSIVCTATWTVPGYVGISGGAASGNGLLIQSTGVVDASAADSVLDYAVTAMVATAAMVSGESWLLGLGNVQGSLAEPSSGVWFLISSAGIQCVRNHAGVKTSSAVVGSMVVGVAYDLRIIRSRGNVEYYSNGVLLTTIPRAAADPSSGAGHGWHAFTLKLVTLTITSTCVLKMFSGSVTRNGGGSIYGAPTASSVIGQAGYASAAGATSQGIGTVTTGSTQLTPTAVAASNNYCRNDRTRWG